MRLGVLRQTAGLSPFFLFPALWDIHHDSYDAGLAGYLWMGICWRFGIDMGFLA